MSGSPTKALFLLWTYFVPAKVVSRAVAAFMGKPVQFILACDSCPRFSPSSLFAQKPCDPFLDQKFQFNPPFFSSYVMSTEADKKTNGVTASDDDSNDDDEQRVKGAKCKLSMKVGQSSRTFCLARLLNGVLKLFLKTEIMFRSQGLKISPNTLALTSRWRVSHLSTVGIFMLILSAERLWRNE